MDFHYTPEQDAFRREHPAAGSPRTCRTTCASTIRTDERVAPDRATFERRVEWQRTMYKAGWVGISWPKEYGGRGASLMEQIIYDEECFRARAPVLPGYSGIGMIGPDADRARHRGAEAALRAAHPLRRRHLVPGLLRAGRGLGPRGAVDARRGPRRPLRRQRPEGVDLGRAVRGLDLSPRAHRSRGAPAPRHQLSPGRHEDAGHHRAPARADERAQALQRGLLRGRGGAEGEPRRQGRTRAGRSP